MIAVGSVIGNYVVRSKLGEGAMGTVWLAEHPRIGSRVAIKVIKRDSASSPDAVSRFFTEAKAANRIGHENIVQVADFGETRDGDAYYIMELLQGESLSARLARGRPALSDVLRVAVQVADALTVSHEKGIVHRDLKPANVFLVPRDGGEVFVKILDFGVAKLTGVDEEIKHRTGTGQVLGTPYYMAPEQAAGRGVVDGRADVYSLGVMLFEMICGQVPFDAPKWTEVLIQHVLHPPPRVRDREPGCPEWLDELVELTLAKDPVRRPTMEDVRDVLREAPAAREARSGSHDQTLPAVERPRELLPIEAAPTRDSGDKQAPPPREERPRAARTIGTRLAPYSVVAAVGSVSVATVLIVALWPREPGAGRAVNAPPPADGGAGGDPARVREVNVFIKSRPAGATVTLPDGTVLTETTPLRWQTVKSDRPQLILVSHEGYVPKRVTITPSKTDSVDVELEPLPPPPAPDAGPVGAATPPRPPRPPTVGPDAAVLPERLDSHDIETRMFRLHPQMRYCANRYAPDLLTITVKVTVNGDGDVSDVDVPFDFRMTPMGLCALRAVREVTFPRWKGPSQTFTYEFEL